MLFAFTLFCLQVGPGLVFLWLDNPLFGRGMYMQTLTPVEPMTQRITHHIYWHWLVPPFVAKFFLYGEALQVIIVLFRCLIYEIHLEEVTCIHT